MKKRIACLVVGLCFVLGGQVEAKKRGIPSMAGTWKGTYVLKFPQDSPNFAGQEARYVMKITTTQKKRKVTVEKWSATSGAKGIGIARVKKSGRVNGKIWTYSGCEEVIVKGKLAKDGETLRLSGSGNNTCAKYHYTHTATLHKWGDVEDPEDKEAEKPKEPKPVTVVQGSLMWQKNAPAQIKRWSVAKSYCEALALEEYTDWRMPTIIELESIIGHAALDTRQGTYWSSSEYSLADYYYTFKFSYTYKSRDKDTDLNSIRCVRNNAS